MIKRLLLPLLCFSSTIAFAQDTIKSDLYLKVVEVMKRDLNYSYDATSNKRPEPKPDTVAVKERKPGIYDAVPLVLNPSPVIIVDGRPGNMKHLNNYSLADVETIKTEQGAKAMALYGQRAKPGVVFITTKKGSRK
ncbi:hypothetical protein H7F15_13780 [Pontibacter sp. Tf4]|uniref:hypothetical protein n=1 Tax=Pontibacter sp. Tf4 TaxID=2761620 RepID=UPI00162419FF|nr:hypothetical protein [Pontibacter sp. Tf4]MBB6612115.1 hypothetical protein [Pontibacter sp. Tf4]